MKALLQHKASTYIILLMLNLIQGSAYCRVITIYGAEQGLTLQQKNTRDTTYILSLGSFSNQQNAISYQHKIRTKINEPVHLKHNNNTSVPYAVIIGPITEPETVRQISQAILSTHPTSKPMRSSYQPQPTFKPSPRPTPSIGLEKDAALMPPTNTQPWSVTAGLGYTSIQNTYGGHGQTPFGRFAIGKALRSFNTMGLSSDSNLGLELGIQNGKRLPLNISEQEASTLGGLPIWTTLQPMIDVLATLRISPMSNQHFIGLVKGGMAYRRWQMDRGTINNVYQVGGEVQAGIGYAISPSYTLSLLYQGIFGANPNFTLSADTFTGHINNIPIQNGILLNFGITL